jgi:4-hydroxy-tetrahydrodipicolinate synthase
MAVSTQAVPPAQATSFSGIWLPMITPLRDGRIDLEAVRRLHRHYRQAGIDGLVVFGSTGEGNLLSGAEKAAVLKTLASESQPLPVMIGVGGVDTRQIAATVRRLNVFRPAGYLVPPPYYLAPTQAGLVWHFRAVADATDRPIVLYNVPKRTGVAIAVETMEILARQPGIAAIKECQPAVLKALRHNPVLPALCGDDASLATHMLDGGIGAIPVIANLYPEWVVALARHAQAGDRDAACAIFKRLRVLTRLLFAEPNPVPVKRALSLLGWIDEEVRRPLMPASYTLGLQLRRALHAVEASGGLACCTRKETAERHLQSRPTLVPSVGL